MTTTSEHNDCRCYELMHSGEGHHRRCPEAIPSPAEEAWIRASREGDFELWEFERPDFGVKKRMYIYEMMKGKSRISDAAKAKALKNYEAAVVRYAEHIITREEQ